MLPSILIDTFSFLIEFEYINISNILYFSISFCIDTLKLYNVYLDIQIIKFVSYVIYYDTDFNIASLNNYLIISLIFTTLTIP